MLLSLFQKTALNPFGSARSIDNRGTQPFHGGVHSLARAEDRRSGHEHIRSRGDRQRGRRFIDATVHFQVTSGFDSLDHLAHEPNLWECRPDEMLMSESRVDSHD